jgi:hypothetical protein
MGYGPVKSSTPGMHSLLLINKSSTPGMHSLYEIILKKKKNTPQGNKRRTKKGPKSKQKTTPESAECTSLLLINFVATTRKKWKDLSP